MLFTRYLVPLFLQLQLSFRPSFLNTPEIVLDDIKFENCADGDVPAGSDQLSCDFENDTCSWYHDYTTGFMWERSKDELNEKGEFHCYLSFAIVCSKLTDALLLLLLLLLLLII